MEKQVREFKQEKEDVFPCGEREGSAELKATGAPGPALPQPDF